MSSRSEGVVAHLAFPIVMGADIFWAIYMIEAGWSPLLAFASAQLPAFGFVIGLEWLLPSPFRWSALDRQTV